MSEQPGRPKPTPGHKFGGVQRWFQASCECGWRGSLHGTQGAMAEASCEWREHVRRCQPTVT